MSTIKKLTLKLISGLLSELQSDTVMGHFCWRLKDRLGESKLTEFIKLYSNDKPVFTISNGLLTRNEELFFPKPLIHFKSDGNQSSTKKENMISFLKNKEMKSIEYLTLSQLNLFLNGKINELYNELSESKIDYPRFETDLRVSVEIDRNSYSSKEGQLFSYHPKFLDEKTRVVIFIKVLDQTNFDNFECKEVLKDVFEIGFGRKKSSGYGKFEVDGELEEFTQFEEPAESNGFLSLGNYLPSVEDNISVNSKYNFLVKYGRLGEEKSLSDNPFKKPLILFTAGGVFFTTVNQDFYGRITQTNHISEFDINVVQFGISVTLKCNYNA